MCSSGVTARPADRSTDGTSHIFVTAAIVCALALIAALFVIEVPLKKAGSPAPADTTRNTPVGTAN